MKTILSAVLIMCMGTPHMSSAAAIPDIHALTAQVTALRAYIAREKEKRVIAPLTNEELRTSIESGVEWLVHAQESNGHFRYEYIPYENIYREDDNIVRQTGALYALGETLKHDPSNIYGTESAVVNAINYFKSISKSTHGAGRCVANTGVSTKCQLGATSLALIGLLDYLEYKPEMKSLYKKYIDGYRTFILEQQKENGGFRNTYLIGRPKQNEAESPFSNGEALLALVRLYEYEKRADVKDAIDAAFVHLKDEPFDSALYLWIMAALKDLNRIEPRDVYVTYARDFTEWRIAGGSSYLTGARNICAYAEGVASALSILDGKINEATYTTYRAVLDKANRLNRRFQIGPSDLTRVLITEDGVRFATLERPHLAIGGFLTSTAEPIQRIDFTQHCVSSYLQTVVDLDGQKLTL